MSQGGDTRARPADPAGRRESGEPLGRGGPRDRRHRARAAGGAVLRPAPHSCSSCGSSPSSASPSWPQVVGTALPEQVHRRQHGVAAGAELLSARFPSQVGRHRRHRLPHDDARSPPTRRRSTRSWRGVRPLPARGRGDEPVLGRPARTRSRRTATSPTPRCSSTTDHVRPAARVRSRPSSTTAQGRTRGPGSRSSSAATRSRSVAKVSPGASEGIGITAAIIIMLLAFGSVVAMGLPDHHRVGRSRNRRGAARAASPTSSWCRTSRPRWRP